MKNKLIILFISFCLGAISQTVVGVDTILKSGPLNKRINLVFMGDGYDNTETAQLVADAGTVSNYLLNIPPFNNYQDYFNVYVIKCVSPQSGITHPGTATDVTEPASPVMTVTNSFNTSFDNSNIHRLLYSMNSSAVYSTLASWFPAYNQVVILGNSTVYGGAGGSYACSSMHSSSKEIVAHEIGHSFANLADEYWSGFASERPNMTANSNSLTIKWSQWIGINSVGVYAYGTSAPQNAWFRPHQNCKMQYLNVPFCPVCMQTIIERIHTLTNPIDAYSPSNASAITFTSGSQWFKTNLVKPNLNTLKTTWDLNAAIISNNTDSVQVNSGSLILGSNTLKFTVIDTTTLTKDVNHPSLHSYSVIWNISNSPMGIAEVSTQMEYSIYPNPVSSIVNLKYNLFEASDIRIVVSDLSGKRIITQDLGKQAPGEYKSEIDISKLTEGNYFLSIYINDKPINNQFVVYK